MVVSKLSRREFRFGSPDLFALDDISPLSSVVQMPSADKAVMKELAFEASMAKLLARTAARA